MLTQLLRTTFVLTLAAGGGVALAGVNPAQTPSPIPQTAVFNQGAYGVWNFAQASLSTAIAQVNDQDAVLASARYQPERAQTPANPRVITIDAGQGRVQIPRN